MAYGGGLYIYNNQYIRGGSGSGKEEVHCANEGGVFWKCVFVWCMVCWISE